MNSNTFQLMSGVGVAGMSWTHHVADAPAATYAVIPTQEAPRHPKRRNAAAATVASVNRGTT